MRLQLRFKGDYAREFGPHPQGYSRVWKNYYLIDKGEPVAVVEEEPDYSDGGTYYRFGINTDISGHFKTRRELYNAYRKNNKEAKNDD